MMKNIMMNQTHPNPIDNNKISNKKFLALKPSKSSLSTMKAFDKDISFIPFIPLSFRAFSDSDEVATLSLDGSRKAPKYLLTRMIKWWLLRGQYNWSRNYFERHKNDTVAICWNGLNSSRRAFIEGAKRAGASTVLFETSPLPNRITIDRKGVNYSNSLPREADFYQHWQRENPNYLNEWEKIRDSIISRCANDNLNVKQETIDLENISTPYLFIPLQVQNDSQIKIFGGLVKNIYEFIQILDRYAANLPDNWTLRIKEHPSSREAYHLEKHIHNTNKIILDNTTDTMDLVRNSEGVVTINSSVGLEALFFGKPVLLFGQAFYGFSPLIYLLEKAEDIEKIFSEPKKYLHFDSKSVIPFLNYLCCEYYPQIERENGQIIKIDESWLKSFKTQLLDSHQ